MISTAFGQACLTIIVDLLNYFGKLSDHGLGWMMVCGYLWKMVWALIMVFPAWLLVRYLKQIEHVDHFDIHTNFNPFIWGLGDQNPHHEPMANTVSLPQ